MKRFFFIAFCLWGSLLSAGSLRLLNDSPFQLRAVILAADGSYMGESTLGPQDFTNWTDASSYLGIPGQSMTPSTPYTPYSVIWYCPDGGEYGINTNQATGATVTAQSSSGPRICKVPPPPAGGGVQAPNQPYNFYAPAPLPNQGNSGSSMDGE